MKKLKLTRGILPFAALVLLYALFKILQPVRFGSSRSMYVLAQQTLIHCSLACGFYYILTMNIYDLTLGVNAILSSMLGVLLSNRIGYPGLIIGCLLCSVAVALVSFALMSCINAPPIIISISLVIIYETVSMLLCGRSNSMPINPAYRYLGKAPLDMLPGLLVLAVNAVVLKYSSLSVYIEAIGSNPKIAESAGIDIRKYKRIAFAMCGFCVGVYAINSLSYSASVASASGLSSVTSIFKPFMACMFASAFRKYLNPMIGLFIGCFLLNMISNGLMANGLEASLQNVVVGFAMIVLIRFSNAARKYDVVK